MQTFLIIFNTAVSIVIIYKWAKEFIKDCGEVHESMNDWDYTGY